MEETPPGRAREVRYLELSTGGPPRAMKPPRQALPCLWLRLKPVPRLARDLNDEQEEGWRRAGAATGNPR